MDRPKPLAERMRPATLDEVLGQNEAIGLLKSFVDQGECPSIVFWGPPGCGKTTLCRALASELHWDSASLNATSASVKDIRKLAERAELTWEQWEKRTLVFIDEIHRLNKGQQDVLLPFVENGTFVLLGSTTENPYFSLNQALRSRVQLVTLKPLSQNSIRQALERAWARLKLDGEREAFLDWVSIRSGGDIRLGYSVLEGAILLANSASRPIQLQDAKSYLATTGVSGDRTENHYDLASAYQKSLRGSDVDAAVYYLARFLLSGEDPRFIARRLLVTASEDVGNADPQAFLLAEAAYQSVEKLGMPEARIPLSQATIYVARAPKSNETVGAVDAATRAIQSSTLPSIPDHLKDKHQPGLDPGAKYIYSHQHPDKAQRFLPEGVEAGFCAPTKSAVQPDAPSSSVKTRILEWFAAQTNSDWQAIDLAELANELNLPETEIRAAMNILVKEGEIVFRRQFKIPDA